MKNVSSLQCDLLVAGGGLSGVCCAVAAARNGLRVVLVQDRPVLGGNASSEIRMHVVGADAHGSRGRLFEVEAREGGIMEEIRLETAVRNPQRAPAMLDLILLELCRAEPNLTLLLNATLVGARMEGARIYSVEVVRESTEERFEVAAAVFADCTGDGRLGLEAGAEFRRGREAKAEFGESLAQDAADLRSLGSSLLYTARKHDRPMPFRPPPWARKIRKEHLARRGVYNPKLAEPTYEYGHWWFEWGGMLDTIKDNEAIRDELLAILLGVWDYIKNGGECPGAENWAIDWMGFVPGKRESRRFIGRHVLTQGDVENGARFGDAIAYGGWAMDLHPPEGVDAPGLPPCVQHHVSHLYDIPLRACLSRNVENLLFAGRNISATHVAFSSTRVMATCAAMGQGIGTAAAVAVRRGLSPAALPASPEALAEVRRILLRDDSSLLGVRNDDSADLARAAAARASSEAPGAGAASVLSGVTRSLHGTGGAPADRVEPGLHRWMSDPAAPLPAWIELEWKEPVLLSEVRLVFDTGMHRELTFSLSNHTNGKILWGPQPETARDYVVELRVEGKWKTVAAVEGNYARLRVHRFPAAAADRLRVRIDATNGAAEARLFEIRAYAGT